MPKKFELRGGKKGYGYTVDGVPYQTQAEVCLKFFRSQAWAARRFKALGKRDVTTAELLNYKGSGRQIPDAVLRAAESRGAKIRVEGFEGEHLYSALPKLLPHLHGKTDQFFRNRHRAAGYPDPCPLEIFESVHPVVMEALNDPWKNKKGVDALPHIVAGDLAHLSTKKNTGAARVHANENGPQNLGSCLGNVTMARIALP